MNKILEYYLKISGTFYFFIAVLICISWYHIKNIINIVCRKKVIDLQHSHIFLKFIVFSYTYSMGIDVKINYKKCKFPIEDSVIYVYTHASTLEPMLMYTYLNIFPKSFAKIALFKTPFVRDVLNLSGSIPLDNNNTESAIDSLKNVEKELIKGNYISMAPEGKRRISRSVGKGEQLLPFKKGAFRMAKNVKTSMIPVVFYGAGRVMPAFASFPNPLSTIYMEILPEISSEEIKKYDHNELREKIRNDIIKDYKNYPDSKIFNGGLGIKYNLMITVAFIMWIKIIFKLI